MRLIATRHVSPPRRRRSTAGCIAVSLILLSAACGGGATEAGNDSRPAAKATEAKKVDAKSWTKSVCGSVQQWTKEVGAIGAFRNIDESADAAKTKTRVEKALADSATATNKLVKSVDKAGVPELDNGETYSADLRSMLAAFAAVMNAGRKDVQALDTSNKAAFYDRLEAVQKEMDKDVDVPLKKFNSTEVRKLMDKDPACNAD